MAQMDYKSFVDAIGTDSELERKRKAKLAQQRQEQLAKQQAQTKQSDNRNIFEKIAGAVGDVGNFVVNIPGEIVKSTASAINIAGTGIGRAVDEISGARQSRDDEYQANQDKLQELLLKQIAKKKDPNSTDQDRYNAEQSIKSLSNSINSNYKQHQSELDQLKADVDPMKQAGATVELASIPLTLMTGGTSKAVTEVGKQTGKQILGKAGQEILGDVVLGGIGGAGNVAKEKGSEATASDYAQGAGVGALLGGGLSTAGQLLQKPVRQEIGKGVTAGVNAVKSNIDELANAPRAIREGGYAKVPGTQNIPDNISPDATKELASSVEPTVTPKSITEPVNAQQIDNAQIGNRTDPNRTNPAGLPDENITPAEQSQGRFYNREERLKETSPKSTFTQKINESLFDSGARLKEIAKEYEQKTGRKLDAKEDPYTYYSLALGADDAASERLAPLSKDWDYVNKNKLGDAVSQYGVARQIIEDRAGDYPPELVSEMQGTINRLQRDLSPEDFQQVVAASDNTVDFNNSQLRRLVDEGMVDENWYNNIKNKNNYYFSPFNIEEHTIGNERRFNVTNSLNNAQAPLKSVKGLSDADRFKIEDPATAIPRAAFKMENQIARHKLHQSIRNLSDQGIDTAGIKVSTPEDINARIELSHENKSIRQANSKLDKAIKRDTRLSKMLATEINNLNKKGLNLSLKEGGQRMTPGQITVAGLGGEVPTSQAGKLVKNAQDESTDLVNQLTAAQRKNPESAKTIGLQQDVIAEGAGTRAETTPSMLGPQDTETFLRNLITDGSRADIDRIKKQIGTRDAKMSKLLDDIGEAKSVYDEGVSQIKANKEEFNKRLDKEVPEGYEVITDWENGKQVRTAVPQFIADAVKGKNDIQLGFVEKLMGGSLAKLFKTTATVASPAFTPVDATRNFASWLITSEKLNGAQKASIIPAAIKWADGLISYAKNDEVTKAIRLAGGGGTSTLAKSKEDLVKQASTKFGGTTVDSTANLFKKAADIMSKPVKAYVKGAGAINRATEYAGKIADAKMALKEGASIEEAALIARKSGGDMQSAGTAGRLLSNFVPFTNSVLQGNKRVFDYAKSNPAQFTALVGATVAAPTIASYTWNQTMYPDVLRNISQYERDNNFIVILGDEKDDSGRYTNILKIPKNETAKIFGNTLEAGLDAMNNENHDDIVELMLKSIGYVTPVQIEKDGQLSGEALYSSTIGANPLIKVPTELATNTNLFTGGEITPERLRGLAPEDQVKANTAEVDKIISKATGGIVNPLQSEIIREGFTANVASDMPQNQLSKRFTGASGARGSNEFYKLRDVMLDDRNRASSAINKAIAANDIVAARDIADRYNAKFKETFDPWIDAYGESADADMQEAFLALRLNLTSRAIKQRQKRLSSE